MTGEPVTAVEAPPLTDDEQLVVAEVARFRARPDTLAQLQADLLEQASTATAVAFLRELALKALAGYGGRDAWVVSAYLQLLVQKEQRAADGERR